MEVEVVVDFCICFIGNFFICDEDGVIVLFIVGGIVLFVLIGVEFWCYECVFE